MVKDVKKFIIFKAMYGRNETHRFFYQLLWRLPVEPAPVITCAIAFNIESRKWFLFYDPKFVEKLTPKYLNVVLLHEAMHYLLLHPIRKMELLQIVPPGREELVDTAVECACNDQLREFVYFKDCHWHAVLPENFDLLPGRSADYYLRELLNRKAQSKNSGGTSDGTTKNTVKGNAETDRALQEYFDAQAEAQKKAKEEAEKRTSTSSNKGDKTSDTSAAAQTEKTKQADEFGAILSVEKQKLAAVVNDIKKTIGSLPGKIEQLCGQLNQQTKISYAKLVRRLICVRTEDKERTIARISRRRVALPIIHPGARKQSHFNVVWCLDTSGSMGQRELEEGLNELRQLRQQIPHMKVTVIEADAAVEKVYELDKPNSKIQYEVRGRGGTTFDPALQFAEENVRPDILFYFTDGYADVPTIKTKCPRYFIITKRGRKVKSELCISVETGGWL